MDCDVKEETEQNSTSVRVNRFVSLMQGLQRVAKLQEEVTTTQIDFRQKRREAAFKRELVCDLDAKFMRELQKLIAQGTMDLQGDFKKFEQLADECQAARDILGPIEQENIEAEQRWEGQIWSLRQAENRVYQHFEAEFRIAKTYPSAPSSVDSQYESLSQDESLSEPESGTFEEDLVADQSRILAPNVGMTAPKAFMTIQPPHTEPLTSVHESMILDPSLLGLEDYETEIVALAIHNERWDSYSGIGDIDRASQTSADQDIIGPPQPLPAKPYTSGLYRNLETDFGTKRDRINRWLENSALASRIEATSIFTILKDLLNAENEEVPSNWAQLVIAYWELDVAARPERHERRPPEGNPLEPQDYPAGGRNESQS